MYELSDRLLCIETYVCKVTEGITISIVYGCILYSKRTGIIHKLLTTLKANLRFKKAFGFIIFYNTGKHKCPARIVANMTEKDTTTKLTRLTWHNFMYILQKYLKDLFIYEAVPQSLGTVW